MGVWAILHADIGGVFVGTLKKDQTKTLPAIGISQASFDKKLLHTTLSCLSRLINVVNVVS